MGLSWLWLALSVAVGFSVEAALGFGSALVTVGVGSSFLPLEEILPAFIPLNLALSTWIVLRHHGHIDRGFLLRRLLPFMALGLPIGLFAFSTLPEAILRRILGLFLIALVAIDLLQMLRPSARPRPLPRLAEIALLVLGGAVHGAFGTGGPMAVYVSKRTLEDKGVFRSTLSTLWLILNALVVAGYAIHGNLSAASGLHSLALAPGLLLGLIVGQRIHDRVNPETFQRLVLAVLFAAALSAILKG